MTPPEETPAAELSDVQAAPKQGPRGPLDPTGNFEWVEDSWQPAQAAEAETPAETPGSEVTGGGTPPPPPPPPAPEGALPPPPSTPPAATPPSEPQVMPAEWPCAGYSGPQPWEAENPPALTQNHVMVSAGAAGQEVVELAGLLAYLGYGTSISAGQNPHAIYDQGVADAVRAFCQEYGCAEDPQVIAARTPDTVGPWLWEALVRAVHKKIAEEA